MKKQNYTSHRTLHTSQTGITLIALIITIIVMLILVGVTINVALNGGLFTKASEASKQMQVEADRETLLSAVVAAIGYDGKVVLTDIELPTGWTGSNGTYTSPKGNTFTVTEDGKITHIGNEFDGENTPTVFTWESLGLRVDTDTEYENTSMDTVVNFRGDGKMKLISSNTGEIMAEIDASDPANVVDKKLDCQITIDGTTMNIKVKMNEQDASDENIYVEAEGQGTIPFTKVEYDNIEVYSNEEVLKMLGITNNVGTYTGTWTVLETGLDGKPTKLVSTRNVASCTLGENNNLDKSISDYKNAVSILNTSAQQATGISSAESIAIEDIYGIIGNDFIGSGNIEYGRIYNYYYNTEESKVYSKYQTGTDENGEIIWSTGSSTGYSSKTFVDDDGNTVVVDSENDNVTLTDTGYDYDLTEDQKAEIGTLASGNYWLASPCVYCGASGAGFNVRNVLSGKIGSGSLLFNSYGYAYNYSYGVRAVVSVSGL